MNKSGIILLIVTLANVMFAVNAACVERSEATNSTAESAVDKVSNFFMEVGCTLKSGAERVKERVESGYNYLKTKITPDDLKANSTTLNDLKPSIPHDDRITFKDSPEDGLIEHEIAQIAQVEIATELTTSTESSITGVNNTAVTIDDRTALTAPEMCPQGEVKVDGKCRKNVDF